MQNGERKSLEIYARTEKNWKKTPKCLLWYLWEAELQLIFLKRFLLFLVSQVFSNGSVDIIFKGKKADKELKIYRFLLETELSASVPFLLGSL